MKKLYTTLLGFLITAITFAQAPEKMSYQAILRDSSNFLIKNNTIKMQISILQETQVVYVETQTTTTNENGLVSIEVGVGSVILGDFSIIDWDKGIHFIKTETDPKAGNNYTITGTSQMLSVPYALLSKNGLPTGGKLGQILKINADEEPVWIATDSILHKATEITNIIDLVDGDISESDGFINTSTSSKTTMLRSLEGINSIKVIDANTQTSGQHTIYWYLQDSNDQNVFTLVSSVRTQGDFEIKNENFVATATHYIIRAIINKSPNFKVTEYIKNKYYTDDSVKEANEQLEINEFFNTDNYGKISIIDPTTWTPKATIDEFQGRQVASNQTSSNLSDFSEVQLNTEYVIGYVLSIYLYDKNKKYLGKQNDIKDNKYFTITNENCKYIRLTSPTLGSLCVIRKYSINAPYGNYLAAYDGQKKQTFNDLYTYPIQGFGDSIIARYIAGNLESITGRKAVMYTYGGCKSSLIRDEFLDKANKEGAINLIYIGHNNIWDTQTIINDVRIMVRSLPHQRFIIATTPTGTYGNEAATTDFVNNCKLLENRLQSIYGNHFLNMRKAIIDGYDMGNVKLTQPFIQPLADGVTTVEIYVNNVTFMSFINNGDNTDWIPSQKLFKIGAIDRDNIKQTYDEYEIIGSTITSGDEGYLTCKLVANSTYRVGSGDTVDNENLSQTPAGGSVAINYIRYLEVVKSSDLYLIGLETSPTTFREDASSK
jgi:hypothetical protein